MRDELESICDYEEEDFYRPVPCGINSNFCTLAADVCDGVANCPNGEDEDVETCLERGSFSELATIECDKKNIYNLTIRIWAVPCDGNYECAYDDDEKDCSLPDSILVITLGIIIVIFVILGYCLWEAAIIALTKKKQMATLPDFEMLHGTEALKETMFHALSLENFEQIKSIFVDVEIKKHHGALSEVVCCIKVSKYIDTFSYFFNAVFSLCFHRIHLTHNQQLKL